MSSFYTVIIECTLQDTPTELPPAASCTVTVSRYIIMQYGIGLAIAYKLQETTVRRQDTHMETEVDLSWLDLLTVSLDNIMSSCYTVA